MAKRATFTQSNGAPSADWASSQQVKLSTQPASETGGLLLLQDFALIDDLAHFDRERIPERVVHAKGGGAHGIFEATHDISDLSKAGLFKPGTKSEATVRFSTVGGESGSADTARDPRGFAIKLRTEEGTLDWVFNNTPVFFIRDGRLFPNFIHTQKRNPHTGRKDPDMFWDFLSQREESLHQVMILFSDRGVPRGYDKMNGYSGHTFKFVNDKDEWVYVQIHLKSDQGIDFYAQAEADKVAGENPDVNNESLYEQIEAGKYPSWSVYVQTMTEAQAKQFRHSVFDLTKVWPQKEFPLRPIGKLTLNKNPENYFAEIEQVAFSPSHLVPGIEPTADPVLQARLFSYPDTHRHRLGVNYQQIPVNAPVHPPVNFQRDGLMTVNGNQGARPNWPSTVQPLQYAGARATSARHVETSANAANEILDFLTKTDERDYEQPRALWEKVFDDAAKSRFIANVAGHLGGVKNPEIKERQLNAFGKVHKDIPARIRASWG